MKFSVAIIGALAAFGLANGSDVKADLSAELGVEGKMNSYGMQARKMKEEYWNSRKLVERASVTKQAATCSGGSVNINGESFSCSGINFDSFLSLSNARIPTSGGTTAGSDIWGWRSPQGREITLWTVNNGMWFIDTTDPTNPLRLGYMSANRGRTGWSDVKVYQNTAYFVKDSGSGSTGIQVFDLTRLNGLGDNPSRSFAPNSVYTTHANSHNIVVDTQSGYLYSVGTNTCSGGLHMINVNNPSSPAFAGCASGDGYTHDAQCVVYQGPDTRYTGRQICLAFNEDTLTIWDVTSKSSPTVIGRRGYSTSRYTHQGWFTDDFRHVLLNDELDETGGTVPRTNTYVVNVEDLRNPVFLPSYVASVVSIDHNLYFWGSIHKRGYGGNAPLSNPPNVNFAYLANYVSGVRVLDATDVTNIFEIGHFDVAPDITGNVFDGAWSTYMHPSGSLAVSSIDRGLFMLRPTMAFGGGGSPPVAGPTAFPTPFPVAGVFPDDWTCDESWYDAGTTDFCDCGCGLPDPDCNIVGLPVYGCNGGQTCVNGVCP